MADPIWPVSLPQPILADYSVSGKANIIRTQMESGRPRVHRISKTVMRQVACSIACNALQAKTFWNFYNVDAGAGSIWFLMPLDTGNVMANHRCLFVDCPSMRKISGTQYMLTFAVETDEQALV